MAETLATAEAFADRSNRRQVTPLRQRLSPSSVVEESDVHTVSPGEVLTVALTALAIFTLLLLRLPYRSPLTNILLSALALSSFYFYLRWRLKIRVPSMMVHCLVLSLALDMIGNHYGLFSQRFGLFPYDIITHFAASALSLIPVMWLVMQLIRRFGYRLPMGFVAFFSATTTFSLAGYYEITELLDERLLGGQRIWTPRDTVQDLAADLAGIIVAAVCYGLFAKAQWRQHDSIQHPAQPD
jgi:hypothetical protein